MLALTFANEKEYDLIKENDRFDFVDLDQFAPGKPLTLVLNHSDGSSDRIQVNHSYNASQISWFTAGSALNVIKRESAA